MTPRSSVHVEGSIAAFRRLHESGCFVLPNPWDCGSAIALASFGYRALATSSAALAFRLGRPDSPRALDVETTLANIREIVEATALPVNADFQSGYGESPEAVAHNVSRCIETGVAGLSIEDATGHADRPLYEASEALERLQAARSAIDRSGRQVVLTARAEAFLVGHPSPLASVLERLVSFADAGADCLYAPGLKHEDEIAAVVKAVSPKPVNVLAVGGAEGFTCDSLAALGVRRISLGSALARVAWGAMLASAEDIAESGSFRSLGRARSFASLQRLFSA